MFDGTDDALSLLGVGGEDYAGGEDYVGAPWVHPLRPRHPIQHRPSMAQLAQWSAAHNIGRSVAKSRRVRQLALAGALPHIPMGVRVNGVAAGASGTTSPEPGVPLRITKFVANDISAPWFLITQLKVARLDMLAGGDAVPMSIFSKDANYPPIENPVLAGGSQITVGFENVDAAPHLFSGAFWGIDLTPAAARIV